METPIESVDRYQSQETPSVDEQQETERLRTKLREMFRDSFAFFQEHDSLPLDHPLFCGRNFDVESNILRFLGLDEDVENGQITVLQRQRVKIFFDEFTSFIKEQHRNPVGRDALAYYLATWREQAFSVSPNIFNRLRLEDQIIVSLTLSRIPEAQGSIAQANGGELVYTLQWDIKGEDREKLFEKIFHQLPIEHQFDFLDYLQTVSADSMAQGWADDVTQSVIFFLEKLIEDEQQTPFIHYAAQQSRGAIRDEEEQPTRGIVIRQGDRSIGRRGQDIRDEMIEEDERLSQYYIPDAASYTDAGGILSRISRDAIASFDHAMTAQSFAEVALTPVTLREGVPSSRALTQAIDALAQRLSPQNIARVVAYVDKYIFSKLSDADAQAVRAQFVVSDAQVSGDRTLSVRLKNYLLSLKEQVKFRELHFSLFEQFEGNDHIMPKGAVGTTDAAILLQELHRPAMRQAIEHDMGISLTTLSLREQIQLLSFLTTSDVATTQRAFAVITRYGVSTARAFLSCEYGKELGSAVIAIAEKLPAEVARAIFERYAVLADTVDRSTDDLLQHFYVVSGERTVDRGKINEELLSRAKKIIAEYSGRAERGKAVNSTELLAQLDQYNENLLVFASMFKESVKGKAAVSFERIRGLELIEKTIAELSEEECAEMIAIESKNWRAQLSSAAEAIILEFKELLSHKDANMRFYFLKKDGKLIAFMRFEEDPSFGEGSLYAGSLNVVSELQGSAIGEALLRATVDKEAKEHQVYAHFFPETSAGTLYVEQFGWVVVDIIDYPVDKLGKTKKLFLMRRDDVKTLDYQLRSCTEEKIKQMYENGDPTYTIMRFTFPQETDRFAQDSQQAFASGMVMSRYFTDAQNKNIRYAAFEKIPTSAEDRRAA